MSGGAVGLARLGNTSRDPVGGPGKQGCDVTSRGRRPLPCLLANLLHSSALLASSHHSMWCRDASWLGLAMGTRA